MKNTIAKFVPIILVFASLAKPILADTTLPDLYIEELFFSQCSDAELEQSLNRWKDEARVIHTSEDGTYFDIAKVSKSNTDLIDSIYRTYCFTYSIGNKGDADFVTDPSSTIYKRSVIIDSEWRDYNIAALNLSLPELNLKPGENYSNQDSIQVNLGKIANSNQNCIGFEVYSESRGELKSDHEETTENNRELICFDSISYEFPKTPKNIIATRAEEQTLELSWSEVEGADYYKINAKRWIPVHTINTFNSEPFEPATIESNRAVFEFPDEELYCMTVAAVKEGLVGPESQEFCYRTTISRFKDVPIDSWYFLYLQALQHVELIEGYKDAEGNPIGYFFPTKPLTVAEAIKVAIASHNGIRYHQGYHWSSEWGQSEVIRDTFELRKLLESGFELPPHLEGHWAERFFQMAYALNLSIAQDLENLDPNRPITRGEVMELFSESLEVKIPKFDEYSLSDIESTKYADLIEYYYQKNYINGYSDGSFKINSFLNRAEAVKIINNFKNRGR